MNGTKKKKSKPRKPADAPKPSPTAEAQRIAANGEGLANWYAWGPYLSDRQWGTVREDYSEHGTAWDYLPHDMARSRAYRWGEDGIAGFCDQEQLLCLSLALWNERDPILKERMFGLTNSEGNHGEDAKELYYYLDGVPSHAYMRMLYKYPQSEYPYADLVATNAKRGPLDPEYELWNTPAFQDDRYFDVEVEYAKAAEQDIVMAITVHNRGPEDARIVVMPQLWFRNTWSWVEHATRPNLRLVDDGHARAEHDDLGVYDVHFSPGAEPIFTDNDSNPRRVWGSDGPGCYKDGFHDYLVEAQETAVRSDGAGTKLGVVHRLTVPAGGAQRVFLRLAKSAELNALDGAESVLSTRRAEADDFYAHLQDRIEDADERLVQRQALAGMLWSKQFFYYDVAEWLEGDPGQPPPPEGRKHGRNAEWAHLNNADVISMPDKWEYPWYAAWDLAFHCLPLALVDAHFAKQQLKLMTREWYMHPNGQIPAYEWNFGDVNPPVHAWATWRVFQIDRKQRGDEGDLAFLESVFHKLMLNFTWWVNRKDTEGRNIFQGGFLGLDNIGVFDRSAPLPTGGFINQSDGTSWVAMFSLNMMTIALELARHNSVYEDLATKFFEHFLHIAEAMTNMCGDNIGLWDEDDEFYYDVLSVPDGAGGYDRTKLRLRNLVGLIPLFAVETIEPEVLDELPEFARRLEWVLANRPHLSALVSRWHEPGRGDRRLLSLLRGHRMKRLLDRMLDPDEFFSDYGIRGVSKAHDEHPYVFEHGGSHYEVRYQPGESDSALFGGNSNWRGPIWMPINYLLIESLQKFHHYYGDDFLVECPTGSGTTGTLLDAADELARRLVSIFLVDKEGRRPVYGHAPRLATDPLFKDYVMFYEYFHGDSGRGVGASHQTGWTGLVAKLLQPRGPSQH
jgi:Mannosylglycerate hydrolase MGH1-like glycoside hydrolase domain/Glycosyl hydrolase family 63 C-terminal domain